MRGVSGRFTARFAYETDSTATLGSLRGEDRTRGVKGGHAAHASRTGLYYSVRAADLPAWSISGLSFRECPEPATGFPRMSLLGNLVNNDQDPRRYQGMVS